MSNATDHPATMTRAEAARFLMRAKFGVGDTDIAALREAGPGAWLDAQFAVPRSQSGAAWLTEQGHDAVTKEAEYFDPSAGNFMIWNQLLAQPDEFRQRCAYALSQFFVVSLAPIDGFWPPYLLAGWWEVLLTHAFGNFRTLLEAVSLNPAMGMYLNTKGNLKEDVATGRQPDENYAREIMQLFTIGLYELNADGTEKKGADGKPVETYVQDDVSNLARVFTGYDHDFTRVKKRNVAWQDYPVPSQEFCLFPMGFDADKHSELAATFLGKTIPEKTAGREALRIALDHLFAHPNVGPFFGRQMIQRFVTSNPSPGYVERVSAIFADNGDGVRGDLRAVWRAVLLDREAIAPAEGPLGGRLREPIQRFVGWARTVGITSETGAYEIYGLERSDEALGQSPLNSPSVFNFYRPGYVPPQTAMARAGAQAPEFQITDETSIAGFLNFMQWMGSGGYKDVKPSYAVMMPFAHDPKAVVDWLNLRLAANRLSADNCTLIATALLSGAITADSSDAEKKELLALACLLVMASPEAQVEV